MVGEGGEFGKDLTNNDLQSIDNILYLHPDAGERCGAGAMKLVNI